MFIDLIFYLLALAITITIHEVAHAFVADRLGDPTPRLEGRLSLNPLVHYDRVGTTMLLLSGLIAAISHVGFAFGWAKPVRFDPYNLKNPRRDTALISLAGPAANILLAVLLAVILRSSVNLFPFSPVFSILSVIFVYLIQLNVALAFFNLIPIHPLDGGKILVGILPPSEAKEVDLFLNKYGMILLLFLIIPSIRGNSPVSLILLPLIKFIVDILTGGTFF